MLSTKWARTAVWACAGYVAGCGSARAAQAPATVASPPSAVRVPAPPGPSPAAPPAAVTRAVMVVDAAHGGNDLGGHLSTGAYEKNATLAFGVRLRSLLGARGIQVVTTRESDQSVEPNQRAEMANHAEARACISLHAAETGSGVHLFVSSLAPSSATRFMPWKTAQAAWITRSLALAGVLNADLLQSGFTVTLGRTAIPGVESMTCPAVAVELAPERDANHKIVAEPDDPDYQARVAATLATALLQWRAESHLP